MSPGLIALILFGLFVLFVVIGVPIGFSLGFAGVIGYITAPFGYNLFVVKSITGRGMGEVSMCVLPFLILSLIGLMIITYIPQVALFFPTMFMG